MRRRPSIVEKSGVTMTDNSNASTRADRMTIPERLAAVAEGRKPDRVPVSPFVLSYAAWIAGIPLSKLYVDQELSVKTQLQAADLHGYDAFPRFGWGDWGAWEFGGRIKFPDSYLESAPRTESSPITKPGDVDKLEVPDPAAAGSFPLLMEFNRITAKLGYSPKIMGGSVTNVVSSLLGRENLLRWYFKEPAAVHLAYDKAAELIIRGADMVLREFGGRGSFSYGAPLDSNDLISPRIFETFAWPRLERIHKAMLDRGIKRFSLHLCGDHNKNLEAWTALPMPDRSSISIGDSMDLETVAEAFHHRHILGGNVSTTTLALGGYADVLAEARRCIEKGRNLPGGFMLMPACEMPVMAPPLNVHALLVAAREYGGYDD